MFVCVFTFQDLILKIFTFKLPWSQISFRWSAPLPEHINNHIKLHAHFSPFTCITDLLVLQQLAPTPWNLYSFITSRVVNKQIWLKEVLIIHFFAILHSVKPSSVPDWKNSLNEFSISSTMVRSNQATLSFKDQRRLENLKRFCVFITGQNEIRETWHFYFLLFKTIHQRE